MQFYGIGYQYQPQHACKRMLIKQKKEEKEENKTKHNNAV